MKDDFPVLRIRYAEDSPRIDSHTHPACELIFVREGEVHIRIDGRQYLAGPGTLTLIGALEQHELEVVKQPYIRHFCILSPHALERSGLDPVLAGVFKNRPHSFRHCIRLNDSRPAERLFEQLEVEDLERAPYAEQAAMGLIEQLLILLYRAAPEVFFRPDASPAAQKVWEAQRFLEQHLDEPVTVKQLAANCYLSPDHLTRLFKQMTGYSPKQYLLENRMMRGCELLLQTDLPVSAVAARCGFPDESNFIRSFKSRYGITPKQYQKHHSDSHHTRNN